MDVLINVDDFVEKYYPNYSSCDTIARWNDLSVILADEHVEGSIAYNIWLHDFEGNMSEVGQEYDSLNAQILETAIQGYIKSQQ